MKLIYVILSSWKGLSFGMALDIFVTLNLIYEKYIATFIWIFPESFKYFLQTFMLRHK
jgi:hypothetical protein